MSEPIDTAPAAFPQAKRFKGRFGYVEHLQLDKHAVQLWDAIGRDDSLWRYMRNGPFASKDIFEVYLRGHLAQKDRVIYAVMSPSDHALGLLSLRHVRLDMRVVEMGGVVYGRTLQKQPLATEVQYLLMQHVFEQGFRRYEWRAEADNDFSRNAALRLGFTFEGVLRQYEIVKGRNRDTAWFSILDSEWPALKSLFERWLAPENFDEKGRQKTPLRHSTLS